MNGAESGYMLAGQTPLGLTIVRDHVVAKKLFLQLDTSSDQTVGVFVNGVHRALVTTTGPSLSRHALLTPPLNLLAGDQVQILLPGAISISSPLQVQQYPELLQSIRFEPEDVGRKAATVQSLVLKGVPGQIRGVLGTPLAVAIGPLGEENALEWKDTANSDQHVHSYHSRAWSLPQVTVDVAVYPSSVSASDPYRTIFSKIAPGPGGSASSCIVRQVAGINLEAILVSADGLNTITLTAVNAFPSADRWYRVTLTLGSYSTGGAGLLVDGTVRAQDVNWITSWDDNEHPLVMGSSNPPVVGETWYGRLSHFRLSDARPFSADFQDEKHTVMEWEVPGIVFGNASQAAQVVYDPNGPEPLITTVGAFQSASLQTSTFGQALCQHAHPLWLGPNWSVSGWIQVADLSADHVFLRRGDGSQPGDVAMYVRSPAGKIEVLYQGQLNHVAVLDSASTTVAEGEWTHFALSVTPTSASLYVNGTSVCQLPLDSQFVDSWTVNNSDLCWGTDFRGRMDDLGLWSNAVEFSASRGRSASLSIEVCDEQKTPTLNN